MKLSEFSYSFTHKNQVATDNMPKTQTLYDVVKVVGLVVLSVFGMLLFCMGTVFAGKTAVAMQVRSS